MVNAYELAVLYVELAFNADTGEQVGAASNMKLVVNSMLGTFSSALAEALAVTDKVGLSQQQLMGVLDSHPMGSPFLKMAGGMMMENKHGELQYAQCIAPVLPTLTLSSSLLVLASLSVPAFTWSPASA